MYNVSYREMSEKSNAVNRKSISLSTEKLQLIEHSQRKKNLKFHYFLSHENY